LCLLGVVGGGARGGADEGCGSLRRGREGHVVTGVCGRGRDALPKDV
jgi:hypothetical protein